MQSINTEKLINEIEKRPALWDMRRKEYSDRVLKRQCWEEVYDVFSNDDMTVEERNTLGTLLHKKWKNVRDNFSRDLQGRKRKSGSEGNVKAPYLYSQQLQFLKDMIEPRKTSNSLDQLDLNEDGASSVIPIPARRTAPGKIGRKRLIPVEERIMLSLDRLDDRDKSTSVDIDGNRHFLLSLLPSLSSLPKRPNSKCRLELMQVINKYEEYEMMQQNQETLTSMTRPNVNSFSEPTSSFYVDRRRHNEAIQHTPYEDQRFKNRTVIPGTQKFQPIHHQLNNSNVSNRTELQVATSPVDSFVSSDVSSISQDST